MKMEKILLLLVAAALSVLSDDYLTWVSNSAGLCSQLVQARILFAITSRFSNRTLLLAPFKSPHYGNSGLSLCDYFKLPFRVKCLKDMPQINVNTSNCYHGDIGGRRLARQFLNKNDEVLCYDGKLPLFSAKHNRDAILRAINLPSFPLLLTEKYETVSRQAKAALGIDGASPRNLTVVHWRRGDQLRTRCANGLDNSVNCRGAAELLEEIRKVSSDSSVYVATNEHRHSKELKTLQAAGVKTLDDLNLQMDDVAAFLVELDLMMAASTFISWGVSEVNDVVEHERMELGRSWCSVVDRESVEESWCARATGGLTKEGNAAANPSYFEGPTDHLREEIGTKLDQLRRQGRVASKRLQKEQDYFAHPTADNNTSPVLSSWALATSRIRSSVKEQRLEKISMDERSDLTDSEAMERKAGVTLLAVTGLLGARFDLLETVLHPCFANLTKQTCRTDPTLSELLYFPISPGGLNDKRHFPPMGLFSPDNQFTTREAWQLGLSALSSLRPPSPSPTPVMTYLVLGLGNSDALNSTFDRKRLTYPLTYEEYSRSDLAPGLYNDLALYHPDIRLIKHLSRSAQIGFKLIVLLEHPEVILKRSGERLARIVISNADVLYTQLLLINRNDFVCIDTRLEAGKSLQFRKYGHDLEAVSNFYELLESPHLIEVGRLMATGLFQSVADNSTETFNSSAHRYNVFQLRVRLGLLDKICKTV